ncbi:MAG: AAA family ATPase [Bacteroidia bacterium]|nr:AAA family ATPase [Bacteroidia bacterium]MCC7532999.1 AAA family ATPase [Bacteroidia bacterium]MCZ2139808.1 AAA family ATPase [Bacteroidia bacterium]
MQIFIVGFMGVGKTTIGRRLARKLNMKFVDTDKLIIQKTGETIDAIFKNRGEESFRKIEADVLRSIDFASAVIATGGGLPCYNNNMEYMNQHGLTVYLYAEKSFIFHRLKNAKKVRPLIKELSQEQLKTFIEEKLNERHPIYKQSKLQLNLPIDNLESLVNREFAALL